MEIEQKNLESLGLTLKESKTYINLLELGSAKISDLSRKMGMPRTSLYPILRKLAEKGFAHQARVGNHEEWEAGDPKELYKAARETLGKFGELLPDLEKMRGMLSEKPKRVSDVLFYRGRAGIKKAYWDALKQPKGSRIFSIEGSKAYDVKKHYFSAEDGRKWQTEFNAKEIILETVFGGRLLKSFHTVSTIDLQNLYTKRLIVTTMMPDEVMEFDTDIFCYRNTVAIIILSKDMVIIMNNQEIADAFQCLFHIIKQFGRKIDLNAYVKDIIASRKA